jgi:hypothetical protein
MRGIAAALAVVLGGAIAQAAPIAALTNNAVSLGGQLALPSLAMQRANPSYPKLDATLARVADTAQTAQANATVSTMAASIKAAAPTARTLVSVPLAVPAVLADIVVKGDTAAVMAQLKGLGVTRTSNYANLISAWIPADQLTKAAAIGAVTSMRAPRARTHVGAVTSQGDYLQRSQFLRASTRLPNLTGAGITVGVLSDSFGCTSSITSVADDIASGDLPAGVQVLEEISDCSSGTDEGRAIAQIVYDVAPGTNILFNTAFNGEADFAAGIVALANAGAKVIVDDVGYFDEPYFQDGIVAQAVDQVRAMGVAYYSSAGNSARDSYEAPFLNSGVVGPAGGMIAGERLLNFDTSGATQSAILPITIPANASVLIYFEWDDPYATGGGPNGGAQSLLDMCLVDSTTGGVGDDNIEFCAGPVSTGQDPFNGLQFSNPNDSDVSAGLTIGVAAGSPLPGRIKMTYSGISVDQFGTNSGTVQGHPMAKGAAAVGAMYFRANAVCLPAIYSEYTLESYSSSGGTPLLFDVNGVRLATPEIRQKPEFVAPDGVVTTFFNPGQLGARTSTIPQCANPANAYNFFGTSAAAPHAAAVAALLLQAQPKANPDDLKSALESTAAANTSTLVSGSGTATDPYVYAGLPVPNFDVGYGFLQADAALAGVLPVISIAPSYGFGNQRVGTTGSASLTLTNSGGFPLSLSSVAVTAGDFTVSNGCPASLAAGASCTLPASFTPTAVGARSATLTIKSNAVQPDGTTVVTVALSGVGTEPIAALSAGAVDFGRKQLLSNNAFTVTLSNVGTSPLAVGSVAVTGDDFNQTNACPGSLAPSASCVITVTYRPDFVGQASGQLVVTTDSVDGAVKTATLSGTGIVDPNGGGSFGWVSLLALAGAAVRRRARK